MKKITNLQVEEAEGKVTRDELHRKWLQQQDFFGTDGVLNKISTGWGGEKQLLAAALLDDDDLEDALEIQQAPEPEDCDGQRSDREDSGEDVTAGAEQADLHEEEENECEGGEDSDDDEDEDDDWKEKILRRRKLEELEKLEEFTPPELDESSQEIMVLMNKASTAQPSRIKPTGGGHMSLFGLGLNSRSISRQSSFMSMKASNSFGTGVRTTGAAQSYVFSRDDSNSRDRAFQKDSQDSQNSDPNVQGSQPGLAASGIQHVKRGVRGCGEARVGAKRKAQPSGRLTLFGMLKRQTSSHSYEGSVATSVVDEGISLFAAVNSIKPLRQGRK